MSSTMYRALQASAAALVLTTTAACNSQVGNILAGVLGGGAQGNQVQGTIQGVDTRTQQVYIQTNGQSVSLSYDQNTQVVYQNRNYAITNLENGDQVTARVQTTSNGGGYYTDYIQVDQPVNGSAGPSSQNVQQFQGTVRQVDYNNGVFTADLGNGTLFTVSMPYNASSDTRTRFQNMRIGDYVRFYGTLVSNSRIELSQFY